MDLRNDKHMHVYTAALLAVHDCVRNRPTATSLPCSARSSNSDCTR